MNTNKGQYFIIRCDRAGVFYAQISKRKDLPSGTSLVITNARKAHGWDGACAVEELAVNGPQVEGGDNRWTVRVPEMEVASAIQIIPVTDAAKARIEAMPEWKRAQ